MNSQQSFEAWQQQFYTYPLDTTKDAQGRYITPVTVGAFAIWEAAIAGLRRDAERLDFIERTFSAVTTQERYLPLQMIWGNGANGRTLRQAADKYMAQHDAAPGVGNG